MPTPRCARSAGVSLRELGMRRCASRNPSAPRLPTALRILSPNTGVYSTQCPSPSITGCLRCFRISSGVRCALIWFLQKKGLCPRRMLRHSLCPKIVDVKPTLLYYASSAALEISQVLHMQTTFAVPENGRSTLSFDDLVRAHEDRLRNLDTERVGGFQV